MSAQQKNESLDKDVKDDNEEVQNIKEKEEEMEEIKQKLQETLRKRIDESVEQCQLHKNAIRFQNQVVELYSYLKNTVSNEAQHLGPTSDAEADGDQDLEKEFNDSLIQKPNDDSRKNSEKE